ncbi:MAG: ATP-dependent endonuclease [Candidatus Binatia bacterium]
MRLTEIKIKNFRSFENETIALDDYTCLVGPNGAGKSTVLQALNVFFRNTSAASVDLLKLSDEDLHHKNIESPAEVVMTFEQLSPEAQEDFKAYYRSGKLIVSAIAEWDPQAGCAEVKQYGSRLVMGDFAPYFSENEKKASAAELKDIYSALRQQFPDLPAVTSKGDMESALRVYEENHPEQCELLSSPNQFYGWSKGENRLRKYLQWVYVPAVKDATTEQDEGRATALGQLLERTIRSKVNFQEPINELRKDVANKYEQIIQKEQNVLDGLSDSLTHRIQEWTHSGTKIRLNWHYNPDKSFTVNEPLARLAVGEHDFLGELARLGHGLQRTVFVSLLQELAANEEGDMPTLLLGFEEPELYQHPPQSRHMASLLEELSTKNAQILLSTHSPYFVSGKGFENIRMIRKSPDDRKSIPSQVTHKNISDRLGQALGEAPRSPTSTMAAIEQIMQPSQNELFFASVVVLVEGIEDVAYISTYLNLTGRWDEFRRHGCHFVIASGKQNLSRPLATANGLGIPVFAVFDSDAEANRQNPGNHPRDNRCILSLCGAQDADPMPQEPYWGNNVVMWHSNIADVVHSDFGQGVWDSSEHAAKQEQGFLDGVKRKNSLLLATTLENLYLQGKSSKTLEQLCERILAFAANH